MKQSMKSKGFERRLLLIMWGLFLSLSAFAQQITVKGHVADAAGEPVIGASVIEGKSTNGTITDIDGNFSLSVSANSTLTVSFVGYKTQTISVNGKTSLKVTLQEDTEVLDEVVVIG
ncbi:carboxypeptidase-like regulatory domain-containing protein, partial [Bacteroides faecis]